MTHLDRVAGAKGRAFGADPACGIKGRWRPGRPGGWPHRAHPRPEPGRRWPVAALFRSHFVSTGGGGDVTSCRHSDESGAGWNRQRGSATASSATIFPGSWTARGARHLSSPTDSCRSGPVTCSTWVSSSAPAWDTIPEPSADTMILGRHAVFFTGKVRSAGCGQDLRQALCSQFKGTFSRMRPRPTYPRRKPEVRHLGVCAWFPVLVTVGSPWLRAC